MWLTGRPQHYTHGGSEGEYSGNLAIVDFSVNLNMDDSVPHCEPGPGHGGLTVGSHSSRLSAHETDSGFMSSCAFRRVATHAHERFIEAATE